MIYSTGAVESLIGFGPEHENAIRAHRKILVDQLARDMRAHMENLRSEIAQFDLPNWGTF